MKTPLLLTIFAFSGLSLLSTAAPAKKEPAAPEKEEKKEKEKEKGKGKKKEPKKEVPALPGKVLVDGFELTVFAEPFEVEYPAALAAGPDGTVYVSVDPDGSIGRRFTGRVVACRDESGDGKADKFWDFIPYVESPRGGHMVDGKFYLIHPPYLSVFWDEDGDGVADKSKQLVDGFGSSMQGTRGGDHTTNAVRMGIDGWLYIAVGDFGMSSSTGTDGKKVTLYGGGVARVRPDGTGLEVYSYYTRNQCDVAMSPYLDHFVRDNTNDGKGWNTRVHHQSNLSNHGYPRLYKNFKEEAVKPLLDLGGGSGTGALYLHEPGFPGDFGDMLYTCDWTTGKIYHHAMKPFEATYEVKQEEWMNLTRATDIDVDGESRLYTADWRGGRFVFAGEGKKIGLIHRVVPKGYQAEPWPDLNAKGDGDLVAQLAHRSAVRRLEAQQILVRRGKKANVKEELVALIQGEAPLYGKVAAIFALKQIYQKEADSDLIALLEDERVREFAVRALGDYRGKVADISEERLVALLNDADPRVRLQAAILIERGQRVEMASELIKSAAESFNGLSKLEGNQDYRFPHTAVEVLGILQAKADRAAKAAKAAADKADKVADADKAEQVTRADQACLDAVMDSKTRGIALAALKRMHTKTAVLGLEEILVQAGDDHTLRLEVMAVLARLVHREGAWDEKAWWGTRPDDRGPYFSLVRWDESKHAIKSLEAAFAKLKEEDREKALTLLAANRLDVTKMDLGGLDPVLMALGAQSASEGQIEILVKAALDSKRKWKQRLACYRALSRSEEMSALSKQLEVLAAWSQDDSLKDEAERETNEFINAPALILRLQDLKKLGQQAEPEVSRIAWKAILTFSRSPLIKARYAENAKAMALDNPRALGYFHALAEMKLTGFEGPIAHAMEGDNTALIEAATAARDAIAGAAAASEGAMVMTLDAAKVTAQIMAGEGKGDLAAGKALFTQQACASCHAVSLDEVQKGPYLGSAGSKFTRDYLVESILAPEATVSQGFRTQLVTMNDGTVHMGFVTREEDGQVDVRNIGGVVTTLKEEDIESRVEQPQSMMPAGLGGNLTVEQFNSLIDYLGSLKEG
ncbi:MAG: DUF7133 domain-containing protein [Roseibacillus sp.]